MLHSFSEQLRRQSVVPRESTIAPDPTIANAQARDDLHALVEEQAARRRVATLVARARRRTRCSPQSRTRSVSSVPRTSRSLAATTQMAT